MYHNAKYYANHPLISKILDDHPDKFNGKTEIFSNFLSDHGFETLDPNNVEQCVISEALNATRDCVWSPFICILALASVIGINIKSIYPDSKYVKYITIYNQLVQPRECNTNETIHILWCSTTHRNDETSNHFVPLSPKTILPNNDMKKLKQQKINFLSSRTEFPATEHLLNSQVRNIPDNQICRSRFMLLCRPLIMIFYSILTCNN